MYERFKNVKVKIVDKDFLESIPLLNVEEYLKKNEWHVYEEVKRGEKYIGKIWIKKDIYFSIFLPLEYFADYSARISDALGVLAESESKNQLQIVEEIFNIFN